MERTCLLYPAPNRVAVVCGMFTMRGSLMGDITGILTMYWGAHWATGRIVLHIHRSYRAAHPKVSDVMEKVGAVSAVAMGVLPGGSFRFGTEVVRGVPQRVFKNLPVRQLQPFLKPKRTQHGKPRAY
jgi:hypothetical protein